MAQVVSLRPFTAQGRVRVRVKICGICRGQSGTRTGFSQNSLVSLCQYHFAVSSHTRVIWGMNERPVGGPSSET